MLVEKDKKLIETQRDVSYLNEIRNKAKRSINDVFYNKSIHNSALLSGDELKLLNKVKEIYLFYCKTRYFR